MDSKKEGERNRSLIFAYEIRKQAVKTCSCEHNFCPGGSTRYILKISGTINEMSKIGFIR